MASTESTSGQRMGHRVKRAPAGSTKSHGERCSRDLRPTYARRGRSRTAAVVCGSPRFHRFWLFCLLLLLVVVLLLALSALRRRGPRGLTFVRPGSCLAAQLTSLTEFCVGIHGSSRSLYTLAPRSGKYQGRLTAIRQSAQCPASVSRPPTTKHRHDSSLRESLATTVWKSAMLLQSVAKHPIDKCPVTEPRASCITWSKAGLSHESLQHLTTFAATSNCLRCSQGCEPLAACVNEAAVSKRNLSPPPPNNRAAWPSRH